MTAEESGRVTRLKLLGTEEISDGRRVRWLELPRGDHPFWVPVNLIPDHLEEGNYVALTALESSEEMFLQERKIGSE